VVLSFAASAKLAVQHNLDLGMTTELASSANNLLRLFVYPAFAVFSPIGFALPGNR